MMSLTQLDPLVATAVLAATVVIALRQMIDLVSSRAGIDRYQAYALASLAADLRVTQVVNGNKGVHVMLDKRYFARR